MSFKQRLIRAASPIARDFRWLGFCRSAVTMAELGAEELEPAREFRSMEPVWTDELIAQDVIRRPFTYPPLYRAELADGIATHQCGYVTADNRLVAEPSVWFTHPLEQHRLFNSIRPFQKITRQPGTLFSLVSPAGLNHYHWLFDALPKLDFLDWDNAPADARLYAPYDKPLYRESLSLLGVPSERILDSREHQVVRADRLVVANHPMPCAHPHPRAVRFWRRQMDRLSVEPAPGNEVLFVSRNDAKVRRLHQEDELIRAAGGEGWRRMSLRGMPLRDQWAAFRSARVIISTHGAALANLVAVRPGTVVLEILPEKLTRYLLLATHMECRYLALRCDREKVHADGSHELVVEPERFREAVARALKIAG